MPAKKGRRWQSAQDGDDSHSDSGQEIGKKRVRWEHISNTVDSDEGGGCNDSDEDSSGLEKAIFPRFLVIAC